MTTVTRPPTSPLRIPSPRPDWNRAALVAQLEPSSRAGADQALRSFAF
jgi:hypothetical protein